MDETPFVLLGKEIPRGGSAVLDLEVAKLHTRTPVKVPVIVERSLKDGPVLLLMAGIHGDEVNGVAILREIIRKKYNKPQTGTIICIPVFNIFGYLIQTREFPDGKDLNRVFPGANNGSMAAQFAYAFTENIAPYVDYVIDFHTGGAERDNAPQIRCVLSDEKTTELAKIFNAPYIINSSYVSKSVRETLNKMKKTVLLYEGGKSKNLDLNVIECGVNGAVNVMNYLGIQNGSVEENCNSIIIDKTKWIRSPYSGMFKLLVKNGSKVAKKEVLGIIQDPFGDFEKKIVAPFDCHVFCVNTYPIINKGDALFHVSLEL
ncbi:succinylglutamate desuccinylase/aspartoacylase family protein [Flavicella sediminum]|uniref:succinylglutamate desuccinylase/aspartoacylase family protein n=1 Tax=Flavicella sediminum TaxID=2585141 RepID=UPI0011201195|nr:succinylglutamate desuccinylase/aspartoacylase family protein [Flavicella sediminum]